MMKKLQIIILMIAIGFSMSAMAQLTYGPRLGLNLANLSGDDTDDSKMLIGFHIGGFGNYEINEMFSIQGELLYDTKGAKYEFTDEDSNKKTAPVSLSYLNIPILAQATFGESTKFFGELGPTFGFLMGAKFDGESEFTTYDYDPNDPFSPPVEKKVKYKEFYKGMDVGLALGGGVYLPVGNMKASVGLRYAFSLGTIAEKSEFDDSTSSIKNSVISINLGLIFGGE